MASNCTPGGRYLRPADVYQWPGEGLGDVSGYDTALAARLGQGREGEMIFFFRSFFLSVGRSLRAKQQAGRGPCVSGTVCAQAGGVWGWRVEDGGLRGCRLETGTVLLAVVSLSVSRSLVQMLMCRSHC